MTDDLKAPERIGLIADGLGKFALAHREEADVAIHYVRADRIATLEAALADMTQQRDAAMAGAVKVRELVWEDVDAICTRQKAPALGGYYSVVEFDANTEEAHFATNIDLGGLAFVFILEPDPLGGRRPKRYSTIEAAKAAAQADYEARIMSALTPDPDRLLAEYVRPLQDEVTRLREGLRFYKDAWKFKTNKRLGGLEWSPTEELLDDCGNKARALLEGDKPCPLMLTKPRFANIKPA